MLCEISLSRLVTFSSTVSEIVIYYKCVWFQDALSLRNRPFLHATTIIPVLAPVLQVWIAQNITSLKLLPYMFTVAVLSHHLRDGQRRGLWFWPFGSTPPLPYWLYVTCELLLPHVVAQMISVINSMPDVMKCSSSCWGCMIHFLFDGELF